MTFRRLAWANVRGSLSRYLPYFLSCTLSVMVFYVFLSFIVHPEVLTGRIIQDGRAEMARGLLASEVIIGIFAFVFILYSTTAFIRARKKEFGLLTLLGMTQRQMRRIVFLENAIIALAALGLGLGLGILFSKLFFMAVAVLLGASEALSFRVPGPAVLGTGFAFLGLFFSVNLVSLLGVRQSSIQELLKAHRRASGPPKGRPVLLALGLVLLGGGYWLAYITTFGEFLRNALPILALTIAGTYLCIVQGSVLVCGWLARRRPFYLRGTNLLAVNRLAFRLTDTARVLFVSSLLIAVVGTALGTFNTVLQGARRMALDEQAYAITAWVTDGGDPAGVEGGIRAYLIGEGIRERDIWSHSVPVFRHEWSSSLIVSNRSYNVAAERVPGLSPVDLAPDEALLVAADWQHVGEEMDVAGRSLRLVDTVPRKWLPYPGAVVVNDETWSELSASLGSRHHGFAVGFEYPGWEKQWNVRVDLDLRERLGVQAVDLVHYRAAPYGAMRQSGALTLFIGMFIAVLFFIAAGSLIYFKLFTEVADDRRQYRILRDLGLTGREFRRLVTQELGVLFFLPLAFGAMHTGFALKTLSNIAGGQIGVMDVAGAGLTIGVAYVVAQTLYFLVTRSAYIRQVAD